MAKKKVKRVKSKTMIKTILITSAVVLMSPVISVVWIFIIIGNFLKILLKPLIMWEAGTRAYSQGRAYYSSNVFYFNEEKKGDIGKRKIAWWPVKTRYGWIWLDYYSLRSKKSIL